MLINLADKFCRQILPDVIDHFSRDVAEDLDSTSAWGKFNNVADSISFQERPPGGDHHRQRDPLRSRPARSTGLVGRCSVRGPASMSPQ